MNLIVGTQSWVYVRWGEVPPGVKPEEMRNAILSGLSASDALASLSKGASVAVRSQSHALMAQRIAKFLDSVA